MFPSTFAWARIITPIKLELIKSYMEKKQCLLNFKGQENLFTHIIYRKHHLKNSSSDFLYVEKVEING